MLYDKKTPSFYYPGEKKTFLTSYYVPCTVSETSHLLTHLCQKTKTTAYYE